MNAVLNRLISGREKIKQGWCQGSMRRLTDGKMTYCILGSVNGGMTDSVGYFAQGEMEKILLKKGEEFDLVTWNDKRGRSQREVVELFDAAIMQIVEEMNS